MVRRTEEDILNPGRVFNRLINDYISGRLTKPWLKLYRARVEAIDTEGGRLENPPPNPPNSIRARIYTNGLDVNLPSSALSVFHPMLPGHISPPIDIGEHVYVIFEDANMSHGLWIAPISSYNELNYADPDQRQSEQGDASHSFEGDSPSQSRSPVAFEYGGETVQTQGRQEIVNNFETATTNNPWRDKRVLMIGDSQTSGAFMQNGNRQTPSALSNVLQRELLTNQQSSFFIALGRVGWGVSNWLSGRFNGAARGLSMPQPSVQQLIQQYRPDVIIVTLGGNDASNGQASRDDYEIKVSQLWNQISTVPKCIWVGPPVAVGASGHLQPNRQMAAQKILSVVGANNFVDSATFTNTTQGRDSMGVHFTPNSPALAPWARAIIQAGATR